jgi:carboxypeptidase PM20D1
MTESILVVLFVLLLFFAALLVFRAMMYGRLPDPVPAVEALAVDENVVAEHLSAVLRLRTISEMDRTRIDPQPFQDLHCLLEQMYPRVHATLKRETVNEQALLYTWLGRDLDLEPILMMGHQDVVPVDPASREEWTHPPFDGAIRDGFVWGRGALDMKSTVITIFEALELLIKEDYQPERTLYLAFGHDEEIGGTQGAAAIAELLEQRGVRLMAVLDEGGSIMSGEVPGVDVPVALVGISEKGHATLELRVDGRPGHSSAPPPHTAIGVLARAMNRLEDHPMPARLAMARLMFDELGAFLPMSLRLMFSNTWLFGGAIRKRMSNSQLSNALIRTTTAVTVIQGGVKDNILPASAKGFVNFRILPGDRVADVMAHARKVISDDAVQIHLPDFSYWEPSPVSPIDSPVYKDLSETIREVFPETVVAPFLVIGATDSRYFTRLSAHVYRFSPYMLDGDLIRTVHGNNERIAVDQLPRMVHFYHRLVEEWTGS